MSRGVGGGCWGAAPPLFLRAHERRRGTLSPSRARGRARRGFCDARQHNHGQGLLEGSMPPSPRTRWGGRARGCRAHERARTNVSLSPSFSGSEQGERRKRAFLPLSCAPRGVFFGTHTHTQNVLTNDGASIVTSIVAGRGVQSPLSLENGRRRPLSLPLSLLLSPLCLTTENALVSLVGGGAKDYRATMVGVCVC